MNTQSPDVGSFAGTDSGPAVYHQSGFRFWRCLLGVLVAGGVALPAAASLVYTASVDVGTAIPDDRSTGLISSHTLTAVPSTITAMTVTLSISPTAGESGFLGDLYAYIQHGDAIAILLNRPGRRADETAGYDDDQALSVTFDDSGPDVHSYRSSDTIPLVGSLTGTFSPDGRAVDPDSVLVTDSRTLMLSSFLGADPGGEWKLFVADLSGGGAHDLVSWGFEINATAVPEPKVWAMASALLGLAGWRLVSGWRPWGLRKG